MANSEQGNVDQEPTSKPAMLKLLTVTVLIATLYVMEARAGWEVIKDPPPMSEYFFL